MKPSDRRDLLACILLVVVGGVACNRTQPAATAGPIAPAVTPPDSPAGPAPTLEETFQRFHDAMASGKLDEQRRALDRILPAARDYKILFPNRPEKVWHKIEEGRAALIANDQEVKDIAREVTEGGPIAKLTVEDYRKDPKPSANLRLLLSLLPENVPVCGLRVETQKDVSWTDKTWVLLNGRWVRFFSVQGLPEVIDGLSKE